VAADHYPAYNSRMQPVQRHSVLISFNLLFKNCISSCEPALLSEKPRNTIALLQIPRQSCPRFPIRSFRSKADKKAKQHTCGNIQYCKVILMLCYYSYFYFIIFLPIVNYFNNNYSCTFPFPRHIINYTVYTRSKR